MFLVFLQDGDASSQSIFKAPETFHLNDYVGYGLAVLALIFAVLQYFDARRAKIAEKAAEVERDNAQKARDEARKAQEETKKHLVDVVHQQKIDTWNSQTQHKEQMDVLDVQHKAEMGALAKQLKKTEDLALNKYVAKFPRNLGALTDFIADTERDLMIMVDSLGYALYSNPSDFGFYIEAIEKALERGCRVRLVLYSLDALRAAVAQQFPPGKNYHDDVRFSKECDEFFKSMGRPIPQSYDEFRDSLLEREQQLMLRILRKELETRGKDSNDKSRLEVTVSIRSFPVFCWLRDGAKTGLFAFRNDKSSESGLTFSTIDTQMTDTFRTMFDAECNAGSEPLYKERW